MSVILYRATVFFMALLPFFVQANASQDKVVVGKVFYDKNNNGIMDKSEKGIGGIPISNGRDVLMTNRKGEFTISTCVGHSVFPILPANYTSTSESSKIGNANFLYINPNVVTADTLMLHIGVTKMDVPSKFRVGAIGDIQVGDADEVDYAAKSIFTELLQRKDIQFHMMLGDLVNDKVDLLPEMKDMMEKLPSESWTLVGNHDRNTSNQAYMNDAFNTNFGADCYAFNYGKIHFIVLNNVFSTGKNSYEGRLAEDQIEFLRNDLKFVPKETTIVINQHIPMAFTRNRNEIFDLLKPYRKVLVLSGHTHTANRYFFKENPHIHELGAGATCGNWWRGEKDRFGVPEALMQCGTPRGYFVVDFDNSDYQIKFKGIGQEEEEQMALYVDSSKFVANIYGGGDSTTVWLQVDSSDWVKMSKTKRVDPLVADKVNKNKSKIYPTEGNMANPLRQRNSSHVWESNHAVTSTGKIHRIRIKAQDSYGLDFVQEFMMRL